MLGELMIFAAAFRSKYYRLMFYTAALWGALSARRSAISYQQGTLLGYNLNSRNAKRASPGLRVVAEKGAFGLRTECSCESMRN